jgi:NitT/TauT family transport system ATP-binding protein
VGDGKLKKYLEIENVSKSFSDNKTTTDVLDNICFSVDKGSFVCIIGQSGCGKTTLLRTVAGFEKASSGKAVCNGEVIEKPQMKYAYIFQDFNQLLPWKTLKQNIVYPLSLNNYGTKEECELKAREYLELVELAEYEDYYVHKLSGGMKQRGAIARALAMQPEIILMDEPFSSLDARTREKIHQELLSVWRKLNLTIVFITHDITEAIHLSTKIIVLGGRPAKVMHDIENKVAGEKLPTDCGFAELWNLLHESMGCEEEQTWQTLETHTET